MVVSSVSWHPDGTRLASGSRDKTVRVWDVATGTEVAKLEGHTRDVSSHRPAGGFREHLRVINILHFRIIITILNRFSLAMRTCYASMHVFAPACCCKFGAHHLVRGGLEPSPPHQRFHRTHPFRGSRGSPLGQQIRRCIFTVETAYYKGHHTLIDNKWDG